MMLGSTSRNGAPSSVYACMQIEGGDNAQLALGVNAVARVQQAGSIHGSVVKILTAAGTITLDDTSILFTVRGKGAGGMFFMVGGLHAFKHAVRQWALRGSMPESRLRLPYTLCDCSPDPLHADDEHARRAVCGPSCLHGGCSMHPRHRVPA